VSLREARKVVPASLEDIEERVERYLRAKDDKEI
jgi:hypothetical protein